MPTITVEQVLAKVQLAVDHYDVGSRKTLDMNAALRQETGDAT
jgi:hypothetical protein